MKDKMSDELRSIMRSDDVPVLIAGAGPAGLITAMTLALHGVRSLVVDRRDGTSTLPRATGMSTRTMELLRSWDLEDDVRAGGVEVEWEALICETLAASPHGATSTLGFPTREQTALVSPTGPACVPQDHLEPLLVRYLELLGLCEVRWRAEVTDLRDGDGGVEAIVRDTATGETSVVCARYAVGADGAHSAVRQALGIAMHGPDRLAECATALFRAPLWEVLGDRRYGLYDITHPDGRGVLVPAGADRWLYGIVWEPGRAPAHDKPALRRRIHAAIGADVEPDILRVGEFTFAAQLAERFAGESTFLVGDAAHRVTPRGGTGMNTAIHDGHDLGWKLAWVVRGWAGAELLDSYELERRPVAEHNVARSADELGSRRPPGEELRVDLGGRIDHHWVMTANGRESTLDLIGPGLTLFTGPRDASWRLAAPRPADGPPMVVRRLDEMTARAMGIRAGGALLVRPDGVPAGWWTRDVEPGPVLEAAAADARAARRIARAA
jgi:putative polyketide hydroxylase